jgi:ankyrin repeat protein
MSSRTYIQEQETVLVWWGEMDAIQALQMFFQISSTEFDGSGSTALHKACTNGHISTAMLLIQHGANH